MKIISKVMCMVWFFIFLIGIGMITSYLTIDDVAKPSRYILHNFYNREENIDTLFLGTSHTMYGIDPEVYEKITGNKAYNCGTNWQFVDGSLALLKEADKLYDVKHVYLDLYFSVCRTPNRKDRTSGDLVSAYYVADYMQASWNKYMYIISSGSSEHYIEALVPQRRYIKNLIDFSYIRSNINKKMDENYKNYIYKNEYEMIKKNGQTDCMSSLENKGFYSEGIKNPIPASRAEWNDWKAVLTEIIEYCQKHDISITFTALPMSDFYIMQAGGVRYDEFVEEILEVIEDSGVKVDYWDFNLVKTEYLSLNEEDYRDISHLNSEGARKATALLADLEKNSNEEIVFYESYQEKLNNEENTVFGITLLTDESKKVVKLVPAANINEEAITFKVTHLNNEIAVDYENITFQYETGKEYMIQSYIGDELCNIILYTGK